MPDEPISIAPTNDGPPTAAAVLEPLAPPSALPAAPTALRDGTREMLETGVVVVVLILLMKMFVAEPYVIPTGSMATTLLGHQKQVVCPRCGHPYLVNSSSESSPPSGMRPDVVVGSTCPNCFYHADFQRDDVRPSDNSGDRVLVAKFLYDLGLAAPERLDVVVFRHPDADQADASRSAYIKRLIGKPNETIGIHGGDLYVYPGPIASSGPAAEELLRQGKFQIVRKTPEQVLAMRRLVYDNDHPATDLAQAGVPPRWAPEPSSAGPWSCPAPSTFHYQGIPAATGWLRYHHLVVPRSDNTAVPSKHEAHNWKPELITDFLGYNTWELGRGGHPIPPANWVGDLILECSVTLGKPGVTSPAEEGLTLELGKGSDRFQASWNRTRGEWTLLGQRQTAREVLARQPMMLEPGVPYQVRFANVDEQLVLWINDKPVFQIPAAYAPSPERGPTADDLQPAAIGVEGADVTLGSIQLWRDSYYTLQPGSSDAGIAIDDFADPQRWGPLRDLPVRTIYVRPGHYLCLGDNSPESYDGRSWGLVPERLLLGRALMVLFPPGRAGRIR